ncbi:APO protein 1, chloroplastic-like [Iris pallida]|uniref:APO protein 1, chloroplastic-like n=1 Tax=Iris pallida TaxID=29817 RepID=A0AAX6E6G3_IRIPA|nr:APO protein 1, chloroplastic-like [Iris pallida]
MDVGIARKSMLVPQDTASRTGGAGNVNRRSHHLWVRGSIDDILLPIESYHLFDPFGRRIKHETRFDYDRIPAVVELCIQAGVELPHYPSRRRTAPIRMLGKKVIYRGGFVEEPKVSDRAAAEEVLAELDPASARRLFRTPPTDVRKLAERTLEAYSTVRRGVKQLMRKYSEGVRVLLGGSCGTVGSQCKALWGLQAPVAGREARLAGRRVERGGPSELCLACPGSGGATIKRGSQKVLWQGSGGGGGLCAGRCKDTKRVSAHDAARYRCAGLRGGRMAA